MRIWFSVVLPLLVQGFFLLAIVMVTNGKGSFVGLSALLLGMFALPLTVALNLAAARRRPPLGFVELTARVFFVTLVFPVLVLVLYAVAS